METAHERRGGARQNGVSQEATMRLQEIMKSNVFTLPAEASEDEAIELMSRERIHHVVIVRGGKVVGVVSDRDLEASATRFRIKRPVGDLMAPSVVSAAGRTTVREAANLMRGRTIGCLPVVEDGKLAGIVTVSDLLTLLGKGVERPVNTTKRWVMKGRGPRRKAVEHVH
jgi:acetoin utilization protein AcuB